MAVIVVLLGLATAVAIGGASFVGWIGALTVAGAAVVITLFLTMVANS